MGPLPECLRWLLSALAVYRLAQLVSIDDGPADLFLRLRAWAGSMDLGPDGRAATNLGRLLACPYCTGVWLALPCALLALCPTVAGDIALAVLGLAGAQAWLEGTRA